MRTLLVTDDSDVEAKVSVWGKATLQFDEMQDSPCIVFGVHVAKKAKALQMSVRENALVSFQTSPRFEALRAHCSQNKDQQLQQVTSGSAKQLVCEGSVVLTSCAILACVQSEEDADVSYPISLDLPFQAMCVTCQSSTDQLVTGDGRLFMPAVARDWTGSVSVAFTEDAVLQFYGETEKAVVVQKKRG